jgi:hypothetical protein
MSAPYTIRIEQKKGYLHARIVGENTPEVTRSYVVELIDACRRAQCSAVLVEENLEGPRMGAGELYGIIHELHAEFRSAIHIAAFVDANPLRSDANMQFVENASANRGASVAGFRTVAEAEAWLRQRVTAS